MAKQTPRSADKMHSDPFRTQGLDPNILAVPPDDPYTLLPPEHKIQAGDIKRVVGENQVWAPVEESEIGHAVPKSGIAYARVTPPEFYKLLGRSENVGASDVCWTDTSLDWVPVPEEWIDAVSGTVIENCRQQNYRCFIATLSDPDNHRMKPIPAHHRVIYPGEKLRRGDKYINQGRIEWTELSERFSGEAAEPQNEQNGFIRYCRPIHHQSQTWYIDAQAGTDTKTTMGSFENPFKTLAKAQEIIEAAAQKVGRSPFGMICSREGVPMMFYDLPEPPPRASGAREVEEETPEPEVDLDQETEAACQAHYLPGDAVDLAQHWGLTKQEVIDSAFQDCNSRYREMHPGEETRATDLWYGPFNEDYESIMWQPCPAELVGLDPGTCDYIFARKRAPTSGKPLLESRLSDVEQQLEVALAVVRELKQELKNDA